MIFDFVKWCVCVRERGKKEGLAAQKREQAKRANDAIFDFFLAYAKKEWGEEILEGSRA